MQIADLTPDTKYAVSVQAVALNGAGAADQSIFSTLSIKAPEPVKGVNIPAAPIQITEYNVNWQNPSTAENGGAPITKVRLFCL